MELVSPDAKDRYDELVTVASRTVVGLDMDGTLSPIVDDPAEAHVLPETSEVLTGLAQEVLAVAIITGRPARQALALGGLDEVGEAVAGHDKELFVLGQYGNERWSSRKQRIVSPRPPQGLSTFLRELPGLLRRAGAGDAYIEEKGLAVAVHTRSLPNPAEALELLAEPITEAAAGHGLTVEPGRFVLEVRAPGMDKGRAVRLVAAERQAGGFLFAGDDLGDLEAFRAVHELRSEGMPGLLVCSGSDEENALRELADLVVEGPEGVLDLLRRFTQDASRGRDR